MTQKFPSSTIPVSVAVVSSDDSSIASLEKMTKALGSVYVRTFSVTDDLVNFLSLEPQDCLIIDLKAKGLYTTLTVVSRIRRNPKLSYLPILILSSNQQTIEHEFYREHVCLGFVMKPLRQIEVGDALRALSGESTWFKSNEEAISQLFITLSNNKAAATRDIYKAIAKSPNPSPLFLIASRHFSEGGLLDEAIGFTEHVLKADPQNITALTLKSKYLSAQGRYREAIAVLTRAHNIAPKNIERLSMMGDIEISLQHPDRAITHFQNALGIDPNDQKAEIGLQVAKRFSSLSHMQAAHQSETPSISKILNNLGVIMAKNGQSDRAIQYYTMAYSFLTTPDVMSKVSFNMGLGYKRKSMDESARQWLSKSLELANGTFEKAQKLLNSLSPSAVDKSTFSPSDATSSAAIPVGPFSSIPMDASISVENPPIKLSEADFAELDSLNTSTPPSDADDLMEESVVVYPGMRSFKNAS